MSRRGMTFVELTIVVALVLLIVAIGVPAYLQNRTREHAATCGMTLEVIHAASRQYAEDQGHFPPRLEDLVPDYLTKVPACPAGGAYALGTPEGRPPTCSVPTHTLETRKDPP